MRYLRNFMIGIAVSVGSAFLFPQIFFPQVSASVPPAAPEPVEQVVQPAALPQVQQHPQTLGQTTHKTSPSHVVQIQPLVAAGAKARVAVQVLAQPPQDGFSPQLIALANEARQTKQIAPLQFDEALSQVAQAKANDMAEHHYFAHQGPDGKQMDAWLRLGGYAYAFAGENLAVSFADPTHLHEAWMASPLHRENILSGNYSRIGLGVARGAYQGETTIFVVAYYASK